MARHRQKGKFLVLADLHFGFDKQTWYSGRTTSKPVHDIAAFNTTMAFARDYQPDIVILLGDNFDMRPVCRHERAKPKKLEGQRLREAFDKGDKFFIEPLLNLKGNPEIHWFDGNHEAWAYQISDEIPGTDGLLDPYSYLRLRNRGIVFHPQGDIMKLGKLAHAHGDTLVRGAGKFAARKAVTDYGSSIRIGHFHTWQVHTSHVLKTSKSYHTGVVIPCLCTRSPHYSNSPLTSAVQGFSHGVVERNGTFDDSVAIIWQGKTTINGKVYG
jgi:hypothetical protein